MGGFRTLAGQQGAPGGGLPAGIVNGNRLVWNGGAWINGPQVDPSMTWTEVIGVVNTWANVLPVEFLPGTYTADVPVALVSGAHVIGGPGVIINGTMVAPGFTRFPFFKFLAAAAAIGTLAAGVVIGAKTISSTVSVAPGTRIVIGQTAATGHTFLLQQYTVESVAGVGPFTLTFERAILFPFSTGDEIRVITDPTDNIIIEGRGMVLTGTGDRGVEFTGANNCHVSGLRIMWDGVSNFGAAVSLDIASLDSSVSDVIIEQPFNVSGHGVLLESSEHCIMSNCRMTGGSIGFILYDCADCEVKECSASAYTTGAGLLVTSNLMTVGCRGCRTYGGSYSQSSNGTGILIGYATDCVIYGASCTQNLVGIDTGAVAVRLKFDCCRTERNGSGVMVNVNDVVFNAPIALSEVYCFRVRGSCEILNPQLTDYSSYGIVVEGAMPATAQMNISGGRFTSGQTGTVDIYINGVGALYRFDGIRFDHTGGAANQDCIAHVAGSGPVILSRCSGTQVSANRGYVGGAGVTLRRDGETNFSLFTTAAYVINAAGFVNVGNIVVTGAVAVAVPWPNIRATDHVTLTRSVVGGVAAITPMAVITAGVGFTVTSSAGDTSTFQYRIA